MNTAAKSPKPSSVSLNDLLVEVRKHYREEHAMAVQAGLAVIASLSLKNRDNCLVLVYEGGAGRGKSIETLAKTNCLSTRCGTAKPFRWMNVARWRTTLLSNTSGSIP